MLTATGLFIRRISMEWKFQFNVIKTAIDWTVLVYLVLPAIGFGLYQYVRLWSAVPAWASSVPFPLVLMFLYLFTWSGSIRLFLEDADQLFLLQRREWVRQLLKLSIGYSLLLHFIVSLFTLLLLAPFLLMQFKLTVMQVLQLTSFVFMFRASISCIRQFISVRINGITRITLTVLLFVVGGFVFRAALHIYLLQTHYFWLVIAAIAGLTIYCLVRRYNLGGSFFFDVAHAEAAKWKLANLMLASASLAAKKQPKLSKRPFLFPNSNILFTKRSAANGLVEAFIKISLRNRSNLYNYLRLLAIWEVGLVIVPVWTRWLIWPAFALMITFWAKMLLEQLIANEYLRLFNWSFSDTWTAVRKSIFLMSLPGVLLLSLTMGFLTWAWVGSFVFMPAGALLSYLMASVASISVRNSHKR